MDETPDAAYARFLAGDIRPGDWVMHRAMRSVIGQVVRPGRLARRDGYLVQLTNGQQSFIATGDAYMLGFGLPA